MKLTVAQLARQIGAELVGDGSVAVSAVGAVESADESDITFITNKRHMALLEKSHAGAVILSARIEGFVKPQLIVKNVNSALIEALNIFAPMLKPAAEGLDPTAKVDESVKIGKGASVGPLVVIQGGVEIGENTTIAAGCKIAQNSKVGRNCRLDANVVVYHNCSIGNNVIIQANSTVGSTGFGYYFIDGSHKLIPHNGTVVIEDCVEIGANSCIDRAKFGETRIGAGTKLDNLVQVAHNVVIGKCCIIAGQVGISGSCRLGDGVVLAGQAGLADNIIVGDGVVVGAKSGLAGSVEAGQQVFGSPAIDRNEALRIVVLTRRLPKMAELLKQLKTRVQKLEAADDNKK